MPGVLLAQKLNLSSKTDSVNLGEVVQVSLTLIHDEAQELIFPGMGSDFGKFELVKRMIVPSRFTEDSLVKDSVVYSVRTFELKDSLPLILVVYKGEDSTKIRSNPCWFHVKNGTIQGKGNEVLTDTSYEQIPTLFDEHILFLALLVAVGIIIYLLIFWLPKYLKKKRIEKFVRRHEAFKTKFTFSDDFQIEQWSNFISSWKNDFSKSIGKNVTGFTTRKLSILTESTELKDVLRKLERNLYDPESEVMLTETDFNVLMKVSEEKYKMKLKELQDVK